MISFGVWAETPWTPVEGLFATVWRALVRYPCCTAGQSFFFAQGATRAVMKIGLLSDTHGWLDPAIFAHFASCDEVWHAGDVGEELPLADLGRFPRLRAVCGNVDGPTVRRAYPEFRSFVCAGLSVWLVHIGGKPPLYTPEIRNKLRQSTPDLFVCGHSHILRVVRDRAHPPLLYLNPGAAGKQGFHHVRTLLRFEIKDRKIQGMEAIELGLRAALPPA